MEFLMKFLSGNRERQHDCLVTYVQIAISSATKVWTLRNCRIANPAPRTDKWPGIIELVRGRVNSRLCHDCTAWADLDSRRRRWTWRQAAYMAFISALHNGYRYYRSEHLRVH